MKKIKNIALIVAAGVGSRMNLDIPKQYLQIHGKTVLAHTLHAFINCPFIDRVVVVLAPDDAYATHIRATFHAQCQFALVGGQTRQDSVLNGLHYLKAHQLLDEEDFVLVHDAARALIRPQDISYLIEQVGSHPVGGLLALPVADTVKRRIDAHVQTIPREEIWLAQTPQMFRFSLLTQALDKARQQNWQVTDEANAIEKLGHAYQLIHGFAHNKKLTQSEDLAFFAQHLTHEHQP